MSTEVVRRLRGGSFGNPQKTLIRKFTEVAEVAPCNPQKSLRRFAEVVTPPYGREVGTSALRELAA